MLLSYAHIKILLLTLAVSGKAPNIKNSYGSLYHEEKERKKGQDYGKLEQPGKRTERIKRHQTTKLYGG